jgi:excisionase family DNA binding protein
MDYAEFAKLVGTSTKTIQRWEKEGRIKATRFGSRVVRVHRSEYNKIAGLTPENMPE